jgi:cell division protein FtsW (lipid II flippase)
METLITTSPSSPLILSFVSSTGTALISSSSPIAKKKKKKIEEEKKKPILYQIIIYVLIFLLWYQYNEAYLVSDYNLYFNFVALALVQ